MTALGRPTPLAGGIVGLVAALVVVAFYGNHWGVEVRPDTHSYLVADYPADLFRTPVYPLFLDAVRENLLVASLIQGMLFVVAALEVFAIPLVLRAPLWVATLAGLLAATNVFVLGHMKLAISEGLAVPLITTLALVFVLYFRSPSVATVWLLAFVLIVLGFTRIEWLLLALPVLLLTQAARFDLRRAAHAAVAMCAICCLVGLYVFANARLNGYTGISVVQRINLLGKVLEYQMQDEAPARYARLTAEIDEHLARGDASPYSFRGTRVSADHWAVAGEYAGATIVSAPLEYATKTVDAAFRGVYPYNPSQIADDGPFARLLELLEVVHRAAHSLFVLFPLLVNALALARRRSPAAGGMCALGIIGLLHLLAVAAGGYGDFTRLHVSIDPLRELVLVAGVAALGAVAFAPFKPRSEAPRIGRPVLKSRVVGSGVALAEAENELGVVGHPVWSPRRVESQLGLDLAHARDAASGIDDPLGDHRPRRAAHRREAVQHPHLGAVDLDVVHEPELDDVHPELGILHAVQCLDDVHARDHA
jgi:hypothetical protein